MPADVTESAPRDRASSVDRTARQRGWLLLGAFAWNTWVWVTRLWNLLTGAELQTRSTGFIVVHVLLYLASLGVGAVVGVIGWRLRREARAGSASRSGGRP